MLQMGTPDYEFVEHFPKTVYIRPVDFAVSGGDSSSAGTRLRRAVSAATEVLFVTALRTDSTLFTLSSSASSLETSSLLGLANDTQTQGGRLAQAY